MIWRRRDDEVDAALGEIAVGCHWPVPESLSDLTARPPQRYGRLIGNRSHPVSLTGFPRLQRDPEQGRLDEQVEGRIAPGTGALAGRYEVTSTTPVPAGPPAPGGTRWSGISGAAVLAEDGFGGDLLCGIVRHDRQADGGGTRLTAHLLTDQHGEPSEFRQHITRHTGWDPVLEPIEPAPSSNPPLPTATSTHPPPCCAPTPRPSPSTAERRNSPNCTPGAPPAPQIWRSA
ncbi:hypothetical protein ACFCX3_29270 [Streptomyces virginiae]|uniref:hypothetical protein n=1 Tax=Streptomyces virginiae TaxID=1961 RepID=UPI0035D7312D